MTVADWLRLALLCLALGAAVFQDVTSHKIRNLLCVATAAAGGLLALFSGADVLKNHASAFAVALVLGLLFWLLGVFRAGDAKFYAALAALMGAPWIANCFIYSMLAGGVVGLVLLLKERALGRRMRRLWTHIKALFLTQKFAPYEVEPGSEGEMPLAVSIALGALLACFLPVF